MDGWMAYVLLTSILQQTLLCLGLLGQRSE